MVDDVTEDVKALLDGELKGEVPGAEEGGDVLGSLDVGAAGKPDAEGAQLVRVPKLGVLPLRQVGLGICITITINTINTIPDKQMLPRKNQGHQRGGRHKEPMPATP